jgi:ferredoxin-thioredoxin reductase catalytic chain
MNEPEDVSQEEVDKYYEKLKKDAEDNGYFLNPDVEFTKELVKGLIINQRRYGYQSCPCRLSAGLKEKDLDIICPCDYRDPDLDDYGTCYCGLYVSEEVKEGRSALRSIPERRSQQSPSTKKTPVPEAGLKYPVLRCKVCGYLCARNSPPAICPICKAKRDRFEKFI